VSSTGVVAKERAMRTRVVLAIVVVVLALSTGVAAAKGPTGGELTGQGLTAPIPLSGGEGTASGDGLIMQTGFFAAAFPEVPDPMLDERPAGDLGPKLTITWQLSPAPGADALTQDVYPYAEGGPLTYMAPGQPFYTTEKTRGGWYRATPALVTTLQQLGVPPRAALLANTAKPAPPARPARVEPARGTRVPWLPIGASLVFVVAAATSLILLRKRQTIVPSTG
jgi:hypothetical protein